MRISRWVLLLCVFAVGCVTTGKYDAKVAELEKARADSDQAASGRERALQDKLAASDKHAKELQQQLDQSTSLAAELKHRLEKLGQNVDALTAEKGQLSKNLEDLRKQKAAADARAATFQSLVQKLHSMIDTGQLKVVIREGRMLIALPNDVLFDSGKTAIKKEGQAALARVAQVLATIPDRHFIVAGHTDNVPIHTALFPSNWELSTRRAVEVTKFLIGNGMKPEVLAAAGYGEHDPVAPNDTGEHQAQNRRIEIVLQPNLEDLPPMDGVTQAGTQTPG